MTEQRAIKRAIVTGATGAVGSALVRELLQNSVEVLVLLRKRSPRNAFLEHEPRLLIKYCALDELSSLQNDTQKTFDAFFHLAWDGTTGQDRQDPAKQEKNIAYALDALEVAARFGCKIFLGAGSQAEYGRTEGALTPDTPTFPETAYGCAKLAAGLLTRLRARQLGLSHIWVRILSVYGPHDGEKSMIMSTLKKLLRGERAQLTRGEQIWDYLFNADAAEALRLLAERGTDGKTYVLGSGKAAPLSEYISTLASALHAQQLVDLGAVPYAEGQLKHLEADPSALLSDVGWRAKTSFEEGIRKTIDFLKSEEK